MERDTYHHKELKKELIEKGIELVNSEGVKEFSLRKAAAACGVSHAAPYSHFHSKEELLDAMQDYITKQFSEILEGTIEEFREEPDILEHLGRAYILFFLRNPQYYSFLFSQSNMKIDLSLNGGDANNYKPFEIYKSLVLRLLEDSDYPDRERKDVVIAVWSFVHGITSLATMKNVYYDEKWEDKIMDLMKAFDCPVFRRKSGGN